MSLAENVRTALIPLLSCGSWSEIELLHQKVQLGWRQDLEPGWGKPRYVERVLAELGDDEVIDLARRCVGFFPTGETLALQDSIWWFEADGRAEVSELTRLTLADSLDGRVMHARDNPNDFVSKYASPASGGTGSVRAEYGSDGRLYADRASLVGLFDSWGSGARPERQLEPYSHRDLLDGYGLREWPDKRLFVFVQALVDPRVRRGDDQAEWVDLINGILGADGFALEESGRLSGHPVYAVSKRSGGVGGRPKNLIFAANGPKPELGLGDALNNDVVILKHAEHCLVYDDWIPDEGLLWIDLVNWWSGLSGGERDAPCVRQALGNRLLLSLASEAERNLFREYFRQFSAVLQDALPALIPQVYLHYDPLTIRQLRARGDGKRFPVQRMDFLLLLPGRARVVLEVDGKQHYSEGEGAVARPSPKRYAETVASDRLLRLAGYEVYRFGGYELVDEARAKDVIGQFMTTLFRRHGVLK